MLTIITGAKGIGKTALLSAAQDKARQQGWIVISETATAGFVGRIGETMRLHVEELGSGPSGRSRITALGVAGFTVTTQLPPERQIDWRRLGGQLLNLLAEKRTGLLFTVDEIHSADRTELSQLAAAVQHFNSSATSSGGKLRLTTLPLKRKTSPRRSVQRRGATK